MNQTNPFTVYHDGSCPLCRAEIAYYRRQRGSEAIDWVDVSDPANLEGHTGLSCRQAMARFHVRRRDGALIDGGRAFLLLWKQLPAFRWAGRLLDVPPFRWLVGGLYEVFLPLRPALQRLFSRRARQPAPEERQ